jgi:hypothetical protein
MEVLAILLVAAGRRRSGWLDPRGAGAEVREHVYILGQCDAMTGEQPDDCRPRSDIEVLCNNVGRDSQLESASDDIADDASGSATRRSDTGYYTICVEADSSRRRLFLGAGGVDGD